MPQRQLNPPQAGEEVHQGEGERIQEEQEEGQGEGMGEVFLLELLQLT